MRLIKENRKRFLGNIWRNYGNTALLIYHTIDAGLEQDLMPKYLWDAFLDKHHARELVIIYHAVENLLRSKAQVNFNWFSFAKDRGQIVEILEKLYKRYWERFHKVYGKRAKERGGWPKMRKTQALKEFLGMGFMHVDDLPFRIDKTQYYYIYTHFGDLWYPEEFNLHQDACQIQTKLGIDGYTGTTLIKN